MKYVYSFMLFVTLMVYVADVFAVNGRTTYQAKIYKPNGQPLESVSVNFRFSVLDPSSSCILYVEDYAAVNMIGSGGLTSFSLGMGTRSYPASGPTTFAGVFDNSTSSFVCQSPGIYNPISTDNRKVVMQFNEGTGWQTLPAMAINSVPYAMYSAKSQNSALLNGKADSAFVEKSDLAALNCLSNEAIHFNGVSFSCIAVGVGSSGITGVTTSGSVLTTGGTASAPVISITAATMSSDGYLTSLDYAEFKSKLSASSTQIVTTLGYAPVSGSAVNSQIQTSQLDGDVSGTVASTVVQSVGGKTAAQVSTSVDETLAASSSSAANTLVKRNASGNFSANDIFASSTNVNYVYIYKPTTSFNIRLQAPTSLAANYTLNLPSSSGTVGQILQTDGAGNLSWVSAAAGSVVSVSATAPLISSGGSAPTISITQSTSSTDGFLSSADWNTFNNKQQATGAAIIATLGYTPAHASSATQWNNNGPNLYYNGGYIGLGTANPAAPLDVSGTMLVGNNAGTVSIGSDANAYVEMRETDNSGTPYLDFANDASTDYDFRLVLNGDNRFSMNGANIGIRENNPTAYLHLAPATSSTGSLKFAAGTLLSTPQSGTFEFDGSNYYVTDNTNTRRTIATVSANGQFDSSNMNSTSNITMIPSGSVVVSSTTASSNSSTGALVVKGGLGVGGDLQLAGDFITGGDAFISGNVSATAFNALSLILTPYIYGSSLASGSLTIDSTLNATKGNIFLAPSGGRIGVGTTNPANAKIHISGPSNQIDLLIQPTIMAALDTATIRFADSDAGSPPMDIVYTDNGVAQISVMGGRFGVGTNLPITNFEVSGSMSVKGGEIHMQRPVTNGGWARGLSYTPDGSIDATTQGLAGIGVYGTSTTTNSMYLTFGASPWNSTVGMHLLPNGRVGVGTFAPAGDFHVKSNNVNTQVRIEGGAASAQAETLYKSNGIEWATGVGTGNTGSSDYAIYNNAIGVVATLTASGNLGLGTTPGEKLDVLGNLRIGNGVSSYIAFSGTTGDGAGNYNHTYIGERTYASTESSELLIFKGNDSDNVSGPDRIRMAAGNIVFDTYASPNAPSGPFESVAISPMISTKMIIKGTGEVGMGTATPAEELSIAKDQDGDTTINISNNSSGTLARAGFSLTNSGTTYGVHSAGLHLGGKTHGTQADKFFLFANSGITSGVEIITTAGGAPIVFKTLSAQERMRVSSAGDIGIGTSTPTTRLEVAGGDINVPTGRISFNAGTNAGTAGIAASDAGGIFGEHDLLTETSRLVIEIFDNNNDQIVLRTNAPSGGANVDMAKIQYNQVALAPTTGNVGVGLETPTSKLHVNGGIRQPNLGQFISHFDGTTRTVSMPAFLTSAYMEAHQDETFTWRGLGPTLKDTAGCNAGPTPNYTFSAVANGWNGVYHMTIGKHDSSAVWFAEIEWRGWGVNLLDAAGATVATGSNQGTVQANISFNGTNWVVEHMQGQVGATNFSCH